MFQIIYSKKAEKFLKKQDVPTRKRLVTAIGKLPLEGDIKKYRGQTDTVSELEISGYCLM